MNKKIFTFSGLLLIAMLYAVSFMQYGNSAHAQHTPLTGPVTGPVTPTPTPIIVTPTPVVVTPTPIVVTPTPMPVNKMVNIGGYVYKVNKQNVKKPVANAKIQVRLSGKNVTFSTTTDKNGYFNLGFLSTSDAVVKVVTHGNFLPNRIVVPHNTSAKVMFFKI
jgi:hypothetical protein